MLSKAIVKSFGEQPVEFYRDEKGDVWLTAEQIDTALGYSEPRRSVINICNRQRKLLRNFSGVTKSMTPGEYSVACGFRCIFVVALIVLWVLIRVEIKNIYNQSTCGFRYGFHISLLRHLVNSYGFRRNQFSDPPNPSDCQETV
jgi:hypothetical protein